MNNPKIITFDNRFLDNALERLESLNKNLQRRRASLADAWRRVMYVYKIKGYSEAIKSLHNLRIKIAWDELMYEYLKGYLEAEQKDSYQMIWAGVLVSNENSDTIYNTIYNIEREYIEEITHTRESLKLFLIANKISWGPQPSKYWNNKTIAFCSLHKTNLTYSMVKKKECFHRNITCSCSNLVILQDSEPFYKTKAGQQLLASSAISRRARYRKS